MTTDISEKYGKELDETIAIISSPGKGLLAADESTGTIGDRFKSINVENVEKNRQQYRQLLFGVAKESSKYIGGVILYEETLFQKDDNGVDFTKILRDAGIVPGIKVDLGQKVIPGTKNELRTQGLTDLDKRIAKYYKQGARFAKWRASYDVTKDLPSDLAIEEQSIQLARYAAICQVNGLVPIVEPEVLVVEGDHDAKRSYEVTHKVLAATFYYLHKHNVNLSRIILKPNMILAGKKNKDKSSTQKVAEDTLKVLRDTVPTSVPAILFLSGGQTEDESAENLNAMNASSTKKPWYLSFSYGRALQESCLKTWLGKSENVKKAQEVYLQKAKNCYLAALGKLK